MQQEDKQPGSHPSQREAARAAAEYSRKFENQDQKSISGLLLNPDNGRVAFRFELWVGEGRKHSSNEQDTLPPPSNCALFQFLEELDIQDHSNE